MTWLVDARGACLVASALAGAHIDCVTSYVELTRRMTTRPPDVVVIDLRARTASGDVAVIDCLRSWPLTPMVPYCALDAHSVRLLVRAASIGLQHFIIDGVDSEPGRARDVLHHVMDGTLFAQFIAQWGAQPSRLADATRDAIARLFREPIRFAAGRDISLEAGISTAALYRALRKAAFPPAKRIFVAARLARAFQLLNVERLSIALAAQRAGYCHGRVMAIHTRLALGLRPSGMRQLARDEFIRRVAAWACRPMPLQETARRSEVA